ncbi:MAG TPA: PIN domain-containing protein [Bryobacteraceae bacterium]|nr:PIN domain-containing protein [Bryobacteraceae bacterium]
MKAVFADTFYWVALTDPNDDLYRQAAKLDEMLAGVRIVTTDEVLSEFLTFLSGNLWMRNRAVETVRELGRAPNVHIFPQSRQSFQDGFELYAARADKRYSLTDCIAMTTMTHEGITDVLTNDRHFEQEGFRALFRDS